MVAAFLLAFLAVSLGAQTPGTGPTAAATSGPQVLVVPITGTVDMSTAALVQRASREAGRSGIGWLVLRIDTPGGRIDATKDLQLALDGVRRSGIRTVAYVDHQAFSAGAWIAFACDQVFMAPGASIGAITPILAGPFGAQEIEDDDVRRKAISGMRSELRALVQNRADARPGLQLVAEAMVDPQLRIFDVTYADAAGVQEKVVVDELGLQDLEARGLRILVRDEFRTRPLTLTAQEALRVGVATGIAQNFDDLVRDEFGLRPIDVAVLERSWSEDSVHWLNGMKPFLFLLGFLLLIIELKSPGFALPGVLGVLLLGLAMFSSYLVGLAEWTEILLFFLGIGLVAVEVFVLPGTVVFGLVGFLTMVVALVLSQQTFVLPTTAAESDWLLQNLLYLAAMLVAVVVLGALFWRILPGVPLLNRVLLQPPESQTGAAMAMRPTTAPPLADLVGKVGVALTDLRPMGVMELDDVRHDVVAESGFVERGRRVQVVAVDVRTIVVAPVVEPPSGTSGEVAIGFLVLLVVIGLALVVAEVFLVSFGVLSIASAVALVSAVFLAFTHHGQAIGFTFLAGAALGAPATAMFALRLLPRTRFGRRFLLAGPDPADVRAAAAEPGLEALVGKHGVAVSDLRPAGFARIDGRRIDVMTRGEMLAAGTPVRVLEATANRVVVTRDHTVQSATSSTPSADAAHPDA